VTALAAIALASAIVSAATATASAAPSHAGELQRGRYALVSGQVALQGRVINSDGRDVARARVMLYAWPASWPGRQSLHPGEEVPMRLVGQAVSTTAGAFAVRISSPAALAASAGPGGLVNLQAGVAGATGASGFYAFSLRVTSSPGGARLAGLWGQQAAPRVVLKIGPQVPGDFCDVRHTGFVKDYRSAWGNIDATYMRKRGTSAWASYDASQSTTFSVGFSGTGKRGSYNDSGSYSFSSDFGFDFAANAGPSSEYYQTGFDPGLYKIWYTPGDCFGGYFTQPDAQTGFFHVRYRIPIPRVRASNCGPEARGTWHTRHTRALTISAGLTVSEINFTASAQTGWSTTDVLYYHNNHPNWTLCGVKSVPGGNPGALVAQ
jgi:hypothetical protein